MARTGDQPCGAESLELSVVVPTLEERDNLASLVDAVFRWIAPERSELLVVDDDSADGTAELARELAGTYPIRCLVRRGERGLATAVVEGIRAARGELVVVMDADLSHPPERIPALVRAARRPGVEMALGSRFVEGGGLSDWPLPRRAISAAARLLARPLTGVADTTSGFFCVARERVRPEILRPIGYKIALELIVRHGWTRIVEVPIVFRDRGAGSSKLGLREKLRYLRHLGRLYAFRFGSRSRRRARRSAG